MTNKLNKKEVKPPKKRFFKALEQKKLEFWIETIYWLPKNEAREAAKNYYDRYPKMGYETYVHHWHESKDDRIYFVIRRRHTCD